MGYPQFNLATLQLIAPSSNMTLQEYNDAYGIDLTKTNIHAFKLVLFGNEKYAIDQIKDVEGGHEVYFNGRILSITNIVQTSDEIYDVANSKPIYIHPITLECLISSGPYLGRKYVFTCLIFNNSSTPFTLSTWKNYINTLCNAGAKIMISGAAYDPTNEQTLILSHIANYAANSQAMYGLEIGTANVEYYGIGTIVDSDTTFSDGVNKIN